MKSSDTIAHTPREKLQVIAVALLGGSFILIMLVFFAARLAAPGDGSQVIIPLSGFIPQGLPVRPIVPASGSLQSSDVVTAIGELNANDLIRDAFTGKWDNGTSLESSSLQYTVLRNGQPTSVSAVIGPFPLMRAIENSLGIYIAMVLLLAIGLFVFFQRPFSTPAQLFFIGSTLGATGTIPWALAHQASDLLRGWVFPFELALTTALYFLALGVMLHLFLVFPRRHPILRSHPRLIIWGYLGIWILFALSFLLRLTAATTPAAYFQLATQSANGSVLYFAFILLAIFSNVRYLTDENEIRQMRWVAWGMLVGLAGLAISVFLSVMLGLPIQNFLGISGFFVIAIPVSLAIAILQANLFDINLLLNRTLVYVPLTAILAGLFAASITLTQKLFVQFTGAGSDAAVVLTTLLLVAVFTPIKDRLQKFVDRHFKEAPDPLKELKAYREQTNSVLQVIEPETIARHTLDVTVQAFDAESGAIYWGDRMDKPFYTIGKWGSDGGFNVPLVTGDGFVLACLALGPRHSGKAYTEQDRVTLQENLALATRALVLAQHSTNSRID